MENQISGKIIAVLPAKTGESSRGKWMSQQYVLQTPDKEHPKKCLFTVWGEEKIKDFKISMDDVVTISFNTEAREKDGKWYGSIQAYKVTKDKKTEE